MLEGHPDQSLPGTDGREHEARVDVVEVVVRPRPVAGFDVVDLEMDVLRDPDGLYGGKVCADDCGFGVLLGHFEGPDSGAGADVEDGIIGRR